MCLGIQAGSGGSHSLLRPGERCGHFSLKFQPQKTQLLFALLAESLQEAARMEQGYMGMLESCLGQWLGLSGCSADVRSLQKHLHHTKSSLLAGSCMVAWDAHH